MTVAEIWEIGLSVIASLGGGTLLVWAGSSRLGKIWADRLMIDEKAKHAKDLEVMRQDHLDKLEALRNNYTRDIEQYKVQLKKSEFFFQKQYEATSELIVLLSNVGSRDFGPEAEWDDIIESIAYGFERTESDLMKFLNKHSAILDKDIRNLLSNAANLAFEGKPEVIVKGKYDPPTVTKKGIQIAEEMIKFLQEAEEKSIEQLHSQSSI